MNRDDLAARVLAAFVDELDEQLRTLNDALLTLERNPADASQLRDVFRVMHTLKGAARAAGVLPVEEACHALESELAAARDAGTAMTGGQIALLFAAADALDEARRALRAGQPVPTATLAMLTRQTRVAAVPRTNVVKAVSEPLSVPESHPGGGSHPEPESNPTSALVVPLATAQPTEAERREGPSRDVVPNESARPEEQQLRVAVHRLDAVVATAGEIVGLAGALADRSGQLASIRQELARLRGDQAMKIGREIARVERCAADDARGLDVLSRRLLESVRHLRQRPFGDVTEALPRVVRDVAASGGKQACFVLGGAAVEVDRSVLEALREPLTHLVRNAVDHGLETAEVRVRAGKPAEGTIAVDALLLGERLRIVVRDDGQGLDLDAIRAALVRRGQAVPKDDRALAHTMFDEGFSTRREATTISGRGVGLGIVRSAVQRLGGSVEVTWKKGQGTTLTLEVPVSVATVRALVVAVGGHVIALPTAFITRVERVARQLMLELDGRAVLRQDGAPVPVASLARLLGPPFVEDDASTPTLRVVILEVAGARLAVIVNDIVEERELVVRPLEQAAGTTGGFTTGAAPLADGRVMLVLDVPALFAEAGRSGSAAGPDLATRVEASERRTRVLVVDDSITTRALEESVLGAAGYDVVTAVDGVDALRIIEQGEVALVVSDIEMPRMDGIELCMRIRGNRQLAELPVILVTSLDDPAHRARGLEAGADAYISKSSFDQDALLETVRQLLGRHAEMVR